MLLASVFIAYFLLLWGISRLTAGKASSNETFYRAERRSPWWAVAFGMLGASLSGVTFVSVPGMVRTTGMTYLQMCLGFILGYALVAFILLPVYYRLGVTSIYTFLHHRFGRVGYRTGASFFLLSKFVGAAVRLFLVCSILQQLVFDSLGLPFSLSALIILSLIWLYTRRGGIATIVWTDCLQTVVLLVALMLIIHALLSAEGWSLQQAVSRIADSPMSRIFVWDDWTSRQAFWKMFLSGAFIVVVMTGLDQDMMQKNLTCRTLKDSQKNMLVNGLLYFPVNLLFLALGVLMYLYASGQGISIPTMGDEVLPSLVAGGYLGEGVLWVFALGISAAAFSSADSAMTALTTCICIDLLDRPDDKRLRQGIHLAVVVAVFLFILVFRAVNSTSVIDAVYTIASYTYGPLLGLFAVGLFTKRCQPRAAWLPWVCIVCPIACYLLSQLALVRWNYHFGYEILLLNGSLTAFGLWLSGRHFSAT